MSGDDIDPVQFGKLIATVEANTEAVRDLAGKMEKHTEKLDSHIGITEEKFKIIDAKDEKRKHFVLGALGAGTLGGATFGEGLKSIVKQILS